MRVLCEKDIPKELWFDKTLYVPQCLCTPYEYLLKHYDMMDECLCADHQSGPIGGESKEETLMHFAHRYGVSTCRIESLALDPVHAFGAISDDLLTTFTDGHVALLDVPCGTGAVGASLLSTVAALRQAKTIPQEPLDIAITGGDYSQTALDIYSQMISELQPVLSSVGIQVNLTTQLWDGKKPDSTASLVDVLFEVSPDAEEFLIIIANFSGQAGITFPAFERSFQHIHERFHEKPCTTMWVEPIMKGADTFMGKVRRMFDSISWFSGNQEKPIQHIYDWFHPFQQRRYRCTMMIHRYERA